MVAPYVDEEVAWAVEKHEALRYFADESVGYSCHEAYMSPISAAVAKAASLAGTAELLAYRAAAEIDEAPGRNQFADGKS
jgi:hypothetical protein